MGRRPTAAGWAMVLALVCAASSTAVSFAGSDDTGGVAANTPAGADPPDRRARAAQDGGRHGRRTCRWAPTRRARACPRGPGWIAEENRRPGDEHWRPCKEASTTQVKGYLGEVSGTCGQTVNLHLSWPAPGRATVSAYRIGWSGGAGARLVWASGAIPVAHHASKFFGAPLYMAEANWPTSLPRISITPTWTQGYYVFDVRPAGATAPAARRSRSWSATTAGRRGPGRRRCCSRPRC